MRMLLIHAETFEYEVKKEAIKNPEPIADTQKKQSFKETLVVFCSVEKPDEKNINKIAGKASESIAEVASQVGTKAITIYPYAHLSSDLAGRDKAIAILKQLEENLREKGYSVQRSPFGWYKSFTITCKGHPLSELSRTIALDETEKKTSSIQTEYAVMDIQGRLYKPDEYSFKPSEEEFRALVEKEALRKGLTGGEPKYLEYCQKFGIEWESYSDVGHMRYGPEATMIFDLIGDYSWDVANSLGIPILKVRGTNMFDLSVPSVREHADLFGSRLYEVKLDEKSFVLRYAACHQQFSMVKDWSLSYRNLPFGTFEVADSYRLEQSGELLLCFRVRKLHMPDLHIYCKDLSDAQKLAIKIHQRIYDEMRKLKREYVSIYNTTRGFFNSNKDYFDQLLKIEGKPVLINFVPEGIYYWVLNIEYTIIDELDRPREIGTFQIDIGNAKRFGISYVDDSGNKEYPPIIHTALIGTVERYLFVVLDQAARAERTGQKPMLPIWLSPVQLRLIPVSPEYLELAEEIADKIEDESIRTDIDDREETVPKRVREAEVKWIPYVAVVGKKEQESGNLQIRARGRDEQVIVRIEDLIKEIHDLTAGYPYRPLSIPRRFSQRPGYR